MANKNLQLNKSTWAVFGAIRFILAMIVFISHLPVFTTLPSPLNAINVLGGKAAVLAFLFISGFSIGHSYQKSQTGFLERRFLRIYPLYFIAVIFTIIVQFVIGSPFHLPTNTIEKAGGLTSVANLFLLQEFLAQPMTYNQPLWSISIEAFFYCLVPFLYKRNEKFIYAFVILSMLLYSVTYKYTDDHLFGFMAFIFAWPWLTGYLVATRNDLYVPGLFILIGTFVAFSNRLVAPDSLTWLTYLGTIIILLTASIRSVSLHPKLIWLFDKLGDLSYPIYLFHFPFCLLLFSLGVKDSWLFLLIICVSMIPTLYFFDGVLKRVFWKPLLATTVRKLRLRVA